MNIIIAKDYRELSKIAANYVLNYVKENPDAKICFPTGNTPLGMYKNLNEKTTPEMWKDITVVCLDEYVGAGKGDKISLFRWLKQEIINPLQLKKVIGVNAASKNLDKECEMIEKKLKAIGGLDLTVLGLGINGHIGFNEPESELISRTRVLPLTHGSLEANAAYWKVDKSELPKRAITLGVGTLLESKDIILLVSGEKKAEILRKVVEEPETSQVPASFLKRAANFTIIADEAATSLIR